MMNGMQFKKRNKTTLYIGIATACALIGILGGLRLLQDRKERANEAETEQVQEVYNVLMYKTSDGTIEFDADWMKSDTDEETVLGIEKDTLVTMLITPKEGKVLESVDIVDHEFHEIDAFLRDADMGSTRLNFVMPDVDIIMNFNFTQQETETETPDPAQMDETEQAESELEGMPYGLTLHGVTANVITAYNGQFDDRDFLQQLGDSLHMDSSRSQYRDVTDVTFSSEKYEGDQDSDKVYQYVYFNDDPTRKVLSTYYMKDNAYVFTEMEEPESETQQMSAQTQGGGNGTAGGTVGSTVTSAQGGTGSTSYVGGVQAVGSTTKTETVSFDILRVSKVFLTFTGDETGEAFYEKAFEYVLDKKLTGNIVGTFGAYKIDPETQKASLTITLNIGGTIKGTYDKNKNTFKFSGL